MQLLGNLLPSAQRLCEATLSFGLFTSRLRLSMQIFGSFRWCRRICSPFRQSGRSRWNSCPTRELHFGNLAHGAAGRFSELAEGVQVLEFYRYLLHLSRLAHCVWGGTGEQLAQRLP